MRDGHEIVRVGLHHYCVSPPGDAPCWDFRFERETTARPSSLFYEDDRRPAVRLHYEKGLLSTMQVDASKRVAFEYAGTHVTGAVLLEAGNPTKQRLVRYQYDPQGRLTGVEDAYGGTLRYEYDKDHRLVRSTDRRGYSFLFAYDAEGRCIHNRGEDGVEEYRFEYKPLERLTVVTRGDGAVTSYYYDEQGGLVQVIDPCGGVTAYLKDDEGRVGGEVDPNGNESEILYDERGQPYAKRDPLGHVLLMPEEFSPHPLSHRLPETPVQWEHGDWPGPIKPMPEGVPLAQWLPRWMVDTWGENPTVALPEPTTIRNVQGLHRLARAMLPDRSQQDYVYDRAGNLLKAPGLEARIQAGNRLLDANDDRFTYNDRDHVATREGKNGKLTYTYDSRDLLVGIDGPGLSYQALHDGLGRRTQKTVNGNTWNYYWDTDRLAAEVSGRSPVTTNRPTECAILESAYSDFLSALTRRLPGVVSELREAVHYDLPYADLPGTEQLAALWRLTSGQDQGKDGTLGIAGGLRLLGPVESESERARWTAMMNKGAGIDIVANPSWDSSTSLDPDIVRPVYYAAGWLPLLSEPYEANHLAVDLVPLPAGRPGQIILCGRDEDQKCLVAPDLATLFRAMAAECRSNAWALKETTTQAGKTTRFIERRGGRLLSACKNREFPGRALR